MRCVFAAVTCGADVPSLSMAIVNLWAFVEKKEAFVSVFAWCWCLFQSGREGGVPVVVWASARVSVLSLMGLGWVLCSQATLRL